MKPRPVDAVGLDAYVMRQRPQVVGGREVGAVRDEQLHCRRVPAAGGPVDRLAAVGVLAADLPASESSCSTNTSVSGLVPRVSPL
jgi:hypothetical protein